MANSMGSHCMGWAITKYFSLSQAAHFQEAVDIKVETLESDKIICHLPAEKP